MGTFPFVVTYEFVFGDPTVVKADENIRKILIVTL